jgi:outer membrane protein assembly factor BamB
MPAPHMLALGLRTGKTVREYTEGLVFTPPPVPKVIDAAAKSLFETLRKRPVDMQARLADGVLAQNAREDLVALDAASGKRLWAAKAPEGMEWAHPILAGGKLYAVQGASAPSASYTHWPMALVQRVVALDLKSGKELWAWEWAKEMPAVMARQPPPEARSEAAKGLAPPEQRVAAAYNMALSGNTLVLAVRAEMESTAKGKGLVRQLALNAATGKMEAYGVTPAGDRVIGGGHSHLRVLPIGDRNWFLEAVVVFGNCDAQAPTDASKFRKEYAKLLRPVGCTVFRASPNWLFGSLTAYALDGSGVHHTNVARTACDVGAFPANGMTYITPNHCFCQPYLPGNNAFHPRKVQPAEELQRLERGKAAPAPAVAATSDAWPMYLHDGLRSSWSSGKLPPKLAQAWTVRLAAPLDSVVGKDWENQWHGQGPVTGASVAEGVCIVALTDRQQVVALDPATGKERWRAALDGRIDSQPTIYKGLVLAGTRTGWIYALNRDTGELVWRVFAAPRRERIVADGQLESPWPLFGTILADDEGVWAFAGRHNDCDGGLWWWRLNTASGEALSSGRLGADDLRTNTGSTGALDELPERFNGGNSPVLSDGKLMLLARVHLERKDGKLVPYSGLVADKGSEHLFWEKRFAPGILIPGNQGLLNRNVGLSGYKMSAYGFTQARQFAWNGKDFVSVGGTVQEQHRGGDGGSMVRRFRRHETLQQIEYKDQKSGELRKRPSGAEIVWENKMDLSRDTGTKALAVAGDAVLIGLSVENRDRWKERDRMPHRFLVLDYERGEPRQELPLPAPAILGGLSSAGGRAYAVTADGTLTCFCGAE